MSTTHSVPFFCYMVGSTVPQLHKAKDVRPHCRSCDTKKVSVLFVLHLQLSGSCSVVFVCSWLELELLYSAKHLISLLLQLYTYSRYFHSRMGTIQIVLPT